MSRLKEYLSDPLLRLLYEEIRSAGPVRSVSLDLTHVCNLRCKGCYYFEEGMDRSGEGSDQALENWIHQELERGTNFVTVVGGEPSLQLTRLKKLYDHFRLSVASNGLIRIPKEGFENLPIGISIWGTKYTDSKLRANGRRDLFGEALRNYTGDERAFWYYTVAPGHAEEIETVVEQCIRNGNRVLFNYYSDLSGFGGGLDYRKGFQEVAEEIDRMIDRYPGRVLTTRYFNRVVTSGRLYDMNWGYDVCTNVSVNLTQNQFRIGNGQPYNPHFRAYNADFASTRRCCTGTSRSCDSCFDSWEHFSWIMLHMKKHLGSQEEFANWLGTVFMFYFTTRLVKDSDGDAILEKVHRLGVNHEYEWASK
ncbi:MAG: radical SAM protein [Bacteroidetes bacterium]|nr:radical SAM protein [Bacteroidota bacterium]